MCLQKSSVLAWDSWNWSGDEIIPSPIVRASRSIPGTTKRYNIDIREFLTTTNNAVVHERLDDLIHGLAPDAQALFRSHSPGSFDLRADRVVQFVSKLKYKPSANKVNRCPDAWLFPDETLSQEGGDCEDLALLLAALLMASGISGYCVRVALGTLQIKLPDGKTQPHDHCWVMYQNEAGIWEILEPLYVVASSKAKSRRSAKSQNAPQTEYVPHYVFNTDHLWRIDLRHAARHAKFLDYCQDRSFWHKFDPSFAASVHKDIFDDALGSLGLPAGAISAMKRESLFLDANIATYDPRDHFDDGYIDAGWTTVSSNLDKFRAGHTDWASFGAAGHGIADFYAHSSYAHFAPLQNGSIPPCDPGQPLAISPRYTATPADPSLPIFDLTSGKFSVNSNKWQGSPQEAAANWQDQLISGRYAQLYDPKAGFWEGFTSIPESLALAPGFALRGSLPHHNEIAVDELARPPKHVLYVDARSGPADRRSYQNQFNWRKQAAVQHIASIYDHIVNHGG
jgi:hypothetical protein